MCLDLGETAADTKNPSIFRCRFTGDYLS